MQGIVNTGELLVYKELPVLNQVEAEHNTLSERFRVTLEKWLQLNVGVTWGNLELAITNANRESLSLPPLTVGKRLYTIECVAKDMRW